MSSHLVGKHTVLRLFASSTTPCYSYTVIPPKLIWNLLEQENLNRQSLSSESVTSSHKSHQHPMNAGIFQSCLLIFTVPRTPRGITYPPSTNRRSHSIATFSDSTAAGAIISPFVLGCPSRPHRPSKVQLWRLPLQPSG